MLNDPGNRTPAPGRLRTVQRFVNTLDIENGVEELETPAALARLLDEIGVLSDGNPLTGHDLRYALEVREALRRLLLANNGPPPDAETLATLERAGKAAHLALGFGRDGAAELVPQAGGIEGALGRILAVVQTAMAAGTWSRLKACRRDVCFWVFYDRSKNHSSKWCAMSVCGNRTKKARAHRRAAAPPR